MPLTRLVHAALTSYHWGKEEMREAVMDQGRREVAALERWLVLLGTIAAVSPLMGLMGTVLGMMETFKVISVVGPGQADKLSGGISTALVTTVTGLAVAIPALVSHNIFRAKVARYILEMENFALQVMRMLGMRQSMIQDTGSPDSPEA
jgi:biopolymer transport protein ExbB